jgi:short-subunit dehydrogenase
LYLTDLRPEPLEALATGLRNAYGVRVIVRPCDLTDAEGRASLFEDMRASRLRFWALINVAGLDFEGPFYERTSEQIHTIVRLNIEGTLAMTHALLEMRDPFTPFRIVNVASLAAFFPMPIKATYAASKRFLLDFSLALREEVRDLGATVTALCPAGLPTTPACIAAIEAQGLMGQLTTQNVGRVAAITLDKALKGRAIVIPGFINQMLQLLSGLVPPIVVAGFVGQRWRAAHRRSHKAARPANALPAHDLQFVTE